MDQLPTILLMVSALCMLAALVWYQIERIERASVRKVNEHERKVLRDLQADTARHNRELREAVRNLLTIKPLPVKTMAEPKRKPANKTAAKR